MFPSLHKKLQTVFAGIALAAGLAIALPTPAHAFVLIPECARNQEIGKPIAGQTASSLPTLDCALETFKNVSFFIYGIAGSAALLFFVYGGFLIMLSGFAEQVAKGKGYIKNATIGLLIIMVSSYATDYFIGTLTENRVVVLGGPCSVGQTPIDDQKGGVIVAPTPKSEDGVVAASGVWGYMQGKLTCVSTCNDAIGPGYHCIASGSADFTSCNDLITSCGDGQRCCTSQ